MESQLTAQERTQQMLHELGFSTRHVGYKVLCIAIPRYAQNSSQSITKELYPSLRKQFGYRRPTAVEHPIRYAIGEAWAHGDPDAWKARFPACRKAPSNMEFIATISEQLK